MSDAVRFRQEAEKCRQLAETATNPIDRNALEWMAAEWLRLAEVADRVSKLFP